nr:unnamed protein product [Digitaria exilis]CAB3487367.1 unnamed protein product [Digitaria exilis]
MAASRLLLPFLLIAFASGTCDGDGAGQTPISRRSFPEGFIFGTSSASYQYEGGVMEGGRGPSIWDTFTHQHPGISNGDVAVDSYHLYKFFLIILPARSYYMLFQTTNMNMSPLIHMGLATKTQEDVRLMKDMGMDAYRFSISWTRILPKMTIRTMLKSASKSSVTESNTGSRSMNLGASAQQGMHLAYLHQVGVRHGSRASAALGIQERSLTVYVIISYSPMQKQFAYTERSTRFMDPLIGGDYPLSMKGLVGNRLPRFTKEQSEMIKGAFDFIGLNYYTTYYAASLPPSNGLNISYNTDSRANLSGVRNGVPIGPQGASPFIYIYPRGLHEILLYIKENYGNPAIYITENGIDEANNMSLPLHEALKDDTRVEYHSKHLLALLSAIRDGANVKGYFAWSLLDNFEWVYGYTVRFGLNFVDYKDGLKRYPKKSAHWFKDFLQK